MKLSPRTKSKIGLEVWRNIKNYENIYQISNLGRVKSLERTIFRNGNTCVLRERILKPASNVVSGHLSVSLHKDNFAKTHSVHVLVITTFVGSPKTGQECRHLNGKPDDCRLFNLKWGTRAQNVRDAMSHGTNYKPQGELHLSAILTEKQVLRIRERATTEKIADLAREYGVSWYAVYDIKHKRTWRHI